MDQNERYAYDNYPVLMSRLVQALMVIAETPVDMLLKANERMALTSAYIGPTSTQKIGQGTLEEHKDFLVFVDNVRGAYIRKSREHRNMDEE